MNKKTNTKASAQAKVPSKIAQSNTPASSVQRPVKASATTEKVAATVKPAKVVPLAKSMPAVVPLQPKARIEFSNSSARSVAIAGVFNSWQPEMASTTGNGAWVKELTIAPGRYEYMLIVDGQWLPDPNAMEFAPNPFGGKNSVLVIKN